MDLQEPAIRYLKPCKHRVTNDPKSIEEYERGEYFKPQNPNAIQLCMLQSIATKQTVGVTPFYCAECMLKSDEPNMEVVNGGIRNAYFTLVEKVYYGFISGAEDIKHVFRQTYLCSKGSAPHLEKLAGFLEKCVEVGRLSAEEAIALVDADMEELKNAPVRPAPTGRSATVALNPDNPRIRLG